ncbi:uncharacterized protein [Montipora capricornis]|uniref:uncharacterized protein n=1 Tax=Montipora capricornis TaxID=246305 RepID=UPI0035F2181D
MVLVNQHGELTFSCLFCCCGVLGLNADRDVGINIAVTGDSGAGKSNFINTLRDRPDRANLHNGGFVITEGGDVGNSTEPILPTEAATYQTSSLSHTEANTAVDSIHCGDGVTWQVTEQSQRMAAGANQANGLSDAVAGNAVQMTGSSQSNQPSETIGGPHDRLCQSGSAERGGETSDRRLADMTIEQASGSNYPVMGHDIQQVSPNWHAASEYVFRVPSSEGAQQINGLPGNHVAQACEMGYLHHANGGNCRGLISTTDAKKGYYHCTSDYNYPVMGHDVQQVSPNWHAAWEYVFRVPSCEGAQQINGLPENHEAESVAKEADGLSVHRVERGCQAWEMGYLHHANGGNCHWYGTAPREAPPFLIGDVTCLPLQEQGEGYAAPLGPILFSDVQPWSSVYFAPWDTMGWYVLPVEPNLVSSEGNAEKPIVHRCSTKETRQWRQQLARSNPNQARKKKNARNLSFTVKITGVNQHRKNERPFFTYAVCNDHQEKLVRIRIHPNGIDGGRGRYVALFIHLIKGKYDNLQVWPLAGTITVSVLDQSGSLPPRDIIRIIQANPRVAAFKRPSGTLWHGYERFARIKEFFGPRYVKEDELFLKIEYSR